MKHSRALTEWLGERYELKTADNAMVLVGPND